LDAATLALRAATPFEEATATISSVRCWTPYVASFAVWWRVARTDKLPLPAAHMIHACSCWPHDKVNNMYAGQERASRRTMSIGVHGQMHTQQGYASMRCTRALHHAMIGDAAHGQHCAWCMLATLAHMHLTVDTPALSASKRGSLVTDSAHMLVAQRSCHRNAWRGSASECQHRAG
jgi:hypothetical protein